MRFKKQGIYLLFVLFLFLASCVKPGQYNARERYIVTSKNLNIRSDPSTLSRIIGRLTKGDTVIALASDKYWIMIKHENQSGFISNYYLQKIEPYTTPLFFRLIESNSNWKSWRFWVVGILLVTLWAFISIGVGRYESYLKRIVGVKTKNLSISPIIFFVAGILTGVLYLFWKDQVIEEIFHNFSFIPSDSGAIAWSLWGQFIVILVGLAIDYFGSIYKSGTKYGTFLFLTEFLENIIIYITTLFLTISIFLFAVVFLTIFFAMQYITMVSENSNSFSEILFKK